MMPSSRVLVVGSIKLESYAAEGLTIDLDLERALGVLVRCVVPAQLLGAG